MGAQSYLAYPGHGVPTPLAGQTVPNLDRRVRATRAGDPRLPLHEQSFDGPITDRYIPGTVQRLWRVVQRRRLPQLPLLLQAVGLDLPCPGRAPKPDPPRQVIGGEWVA